MAIDVLPPPAIYDHVYSKPMIVKVVTLEQANQACRALGAVTQAGWMIWACSVPGADSCFVVLPFADGAKINRTDQENLYRHERAHCNGWPMDHSAGPKLTQ